MLSKYKWIQEMEERVNSWKLLPLPPIPPHPETPSLLTSLNSKQRHIHTHTHIYCEPHLKIICSRKSRHEIWKPEVAAYCRFLLCSLGWYSPLFCPLHSELEFSEAKATSIPKFWKPTTKNKLMGVISRHIGKFLFLSQHFHWVHCLLLVFW